MEGEPGNPEIGRSTGGGNTCRYSDLEFGFIASIPKGLLREISQQHKPLVQAILDLLHGAPHLRNHVQKNPTCLEKMTVHLNTRMRRISCPDKWTIVMSIYYPFIDGVTRNHVDTCPECSAEVAEIRRWGFDPAEYTIN